MTEKITLDSHGRYFTVKPLILVTTLGLKGLPNVAPKTQNMDVGRHEQYFAFVCTPEHHTYQNAKMNRVRSQLPWPRTHRQSFCRSATC